jgi:hypothetical protein
MGCPNFKRFNASNYYVINDTYEGDNGENVLKDEWDYECDFEFVRDYAKSIDGTFGQPTNDNRWKNKLGGETIALSDAETTEFGNSRPSFLTFQITDEIIAVGGYYSGATLDYDIELVNYNNGDKYLLSEFVDTEPMVDMIMDDLCDLVDWECAEWGKGTWEIQKKNVRKYLEREIQRHIDKLEDICKNTCEEVLVCGGVFSNGEAIYYKADSLKGKVKNIEG